MRLWIFFESFVGKGALLWDFCFERANARIRSSERRLNNYPTYQQDHGVILALFIYLLWLKIVKNWIVKFSPRKILCPYRHLLQGKCLRSPFFSRVFVLFFFLTNKKYFDLSLVNNFRDIRGSWEGGLPWEFLKYNTLLRWTSSRISEFFEWIMMVILSSILMKLHVFQCADGNVRENL